MNKPKDSLIKRRDFIFLLWGVWIGTLGTKTAKEITTVLNENASPETILTPVKEQSAQETVSEIPDNTQQTLSEPAETATETANITTPRWKPLASIPGRPGNLGFFLTSDDGTPLRPGDTLAFAKWLQEREVQAHFFINGRNDGWNIFQKPSAQEYTQLVSFIWKIAAHGHLIHNHSWNHTSMADITTWPQLDDYLAGISELQGAIAEWAPHQKEHYFRYAWWRSPKETSKNIQERIEGLFEKWNLRAIQWTHDTEDWRWDKKIAPTFTSATKEGGTLLMHDRNWEHVRTSIERILKD